MTRFTDRLRIVWSLYRPVRGLLGLYLIAVVVGAVIEGLALAAIVPLVGGDTGSIGRFFDSLLGAVRLETTEQGLVILVGVLFVLRAGTKYASTLLAGLMVRRQAVRLQVDLFRLYLGADWQVAAGLTHGEVQYMLTSQTRRVADFLGQLVQMLESTVFVIGLTAAAMLVSARHTLLAMVLVGATAGFVTVLSSRIQTYAASALERSKLQASALIEYARGAQVLRSYRVSEIAVEDVEQQALDREFYAFKSQRAAALAVALPDLLFVLALLAVVAVAFQAGEGVGEVAAVIALLYRISQYLKRFSSLAALRGRVPDLRDVHRNQKRLREHPARDPERMMDDSLVAGSILLEDVTFRFEGAAHLAVDHVSARVAAGQFVGVVGSSGGGKSTLVHIIVGLLEPQVGKVGVGGNPDIRKDVLAFVPQVPFILKGTVAANIRWFRDINDERVVDAAQRAGLDPVLARLPRGINEEIGQEGLTLSGGERQRLVLARALAGSPRLLVLDEATSALDSESEAIIRRALDELRGTVTIVAVAHRLSTILSADRVWVMENGRLVEDAPPAGLLTQKSSRFAQLGALQGLAPNDRS